MWGRYLLLLGVTGCADFAGIGDPSPLADTADAPCTIGGLDLCLYARPTTDIVIDDDLALSTSSDCTIEYFVVPGPSMCMIYGRNIEVRATLRATGTRSLVLVASQQLTITGTVDVSSYRMNGDGAAANDSECATGTAASSAGAGGSFGGKGGDAGMDVMGMTTRRLAAAAIALPGRMRGGCRGNAGGSSGGAVWLAAGGEIVLEPGSRVLANGAGGAPNVGLGYFGGAGGSGGFVRMAAPALRVSGIVTANGGGGAEGIEGSLILRPGEDGQASALPAAGGAGGTAAGGDGGAGGAGAMPNGGNGANASGSMGAYGGSGGGGVGFVHLVSDAIELANATLSPPPIQ